MNNEPVAWMHQNPDYPISKHWSQEYNIPLYTHPANLTDEEIEQVRVAIMGVAYWCADENMPEAYNAVKVMCSKVLAMLRGEK